MGLFSDEEPVKYEIDDKQLICMFCRNDTFYITTEQLNSTTFKYMSMALFDRTATCLFCSSCGYMHWFMR